MIRTMRAADIPDLMRLKEAAGWNQTEQDWINVMAVETDGCWVSEQQGEVVASTTAVCYGDELGWIGMVLVDPRFRRHGLARELMEHALAWLDARGVRQVKLDATDMGRPLYAKLGFRPECVIERWGAVREREPAGARGDSPLSPQRVIALDRECAGVDRSRLISQLLRAYPGQGVSGDDGFVLGRPGSNAYYLGPCLAEAPETARPRIAELMARAPAGRFFWDLLPDVAAAVEVARSLGFERQRSLLRMRLRDELSPPGRPECVLGVAGFEYG